MIVSHTNYVLAGALLTGLVAAYWILIDSIRLRAAMREDRTDLHVRDKLFGSSLGIVIGIIGVLGVVKYYWL